MSVSNTLNFRVSNDVCIIQRPRVSSEAEAAEDDDYIPYVPVKERKKAEVCCVTITKTIYIDKCYCGE